MEISYLIYLRTNFQKYRDYIEIKAVLSVKIKVVEQSGAAIKSVLQRSDPFREKTYSKVDHLVCRNNGKVSCRSTGRSLWASMSRLRDSYDVRTCFRVDWELSSLRPKMSRKESEESSNTPSVIRRKRDERFSSGSSPEALQPSRRSRLLRSWAITRTIVTFG